MNGRRGPLFLEQIFTIATRAKNKIVIKNVRVNILDEKNKFVCVKLKAIKKLELILMGRRENISKSILNIIAIERNKKLISSLELSDVAVK